MRAMGLGMLSLGAKTWCVATIVGVVLSIATTYSLCVFVEHQCVAWLPMISDTFVPAPGNYLSRWVLNKAALSIAGLKKWVEVGNSGVFRPEMLRPMGFPEGVSVIAWGMSLERPTMIKYKIENIRDLFGHKADINAQRSAPIAKF